MDGIVRNGKPELGNLISLHAKNSMHRWQKQRSKYDETYPKPDYMADIMDIRTLHLNANSDYLSWLEDMTVMLSKDLSGMINFISDFTSQHPEYKEMINLKTERYRSGNVDIRYAIRQICEKGGRKSFRAPHA